MEEKGLVGTDIGAFELILVKGGLIGRGLDYLYYRVHVLLASAIFDFGIVGIVSFQL